LDDPEAGMEEVCPKLSHFLTTFCLQEVFYGTSQGYCVEREDVLPQELVTRPVTPLCLDGMWIWKEPTRWYYSCDDRLMIMRDYYCGYNIVVREESAIELLANPSDVSVNGRRLSRE
jgi:hypothetical protein